MSKETLTFRDVETTKRKFTTIRLLLFKGCRY